MRVKMSESGASKNDMICRRLSVGGVSVEGTGMSLAHGNL